MKNAEMAELLENHPLVKNIMKENADAVLADRRLAAEKLRTANEEAGRIIPEYQKRVDAMVADLAEHDKGRKAIMDRLISAKAELMKEKQRLDRELSDAETALLQNYDPVIDEGIAFFRDYFEGLRVKHIDIQRRTGATNLIRETKEVFVYSNLKVIKNAMNYCRSAINELEKMKLSPELDADRIEALKKGIPDADELSEVAGEKPLPGSKGMNPLHFLKSDGQLAWEMGRIAEKFKKVMGR